MDINIDNVNFDKEVRKPIVFEIMADELLSLSRATVQVYQKPKHTVKMNDESLPQV